AEGTSAQDNAGPTTTSKEAQVKPVTVKQENPDSSRLFVLASQEGEYGAPLYSGLGQEVESEKTTVGWTGQVRTKYINRYGKKSAARYRLENYTDGKYDENDRPEVDNVSNQDNRLGDHKIGTKLRYTRRHMRCLYGVAWEGKGFEPSKHDLDLLNPDTPRKRWVQTYVLVAWETPDNDGKVTTKVKWETRSALRARWGSKQADKAIYEAACAAETRYDEGITGRRITNDRMPSVGLNDEFMRHMREQSVLAPKSAAPERARSATPKEFNLQTWKNLYLEMVEKRFEDLSPDEQASMLVACMKAKDLYNS
ncbi:hypothetical protein CC86DRAFT_414129, partial [Ophiobolus disseminans]